MGLKEMSLYVYKSLQGAKLGFVATKSTSFAHFCHFGLFWHWDFTRERN